MQTNIPLAYQLAAAGGGSWLPQPYIQMPHQLQPVRTQPHLHIFCAFKKIMLRGEGNECQLYIPLSPPIYFTSFIDHFADTVAILISIILKDIMGCSGGKLYLPRASHNSYLRNKNQNGHHIFLLKLGVPIQLYL